MPKYHFDFVSETDEILDPTGLDFDCTPAAYRHAMAIALKASSTIPDPGLRGWRVEIRTASSGRPIAIPFRFAAPYGASVAKHARLAAARLRQRRPDLLKGLRS